MSNVTSQPTTRSSRRPRMSAEDRRAAILAAARGAFAESGYQGAGTAQIAAAAGCSEAILYRHFPSKRALLLEVLRTEVQGRVEGGRAMAPPPGVDPASALPEVLRARLGDGEMVVTIRLILLALSMSGDPEVAQVLRTLFDGARAPVRAALERGQRSGSVRDDVDAELLTWLWHGLFIAAGVRNALADDGVAREAIEAARVLAAALAPPAAG